MTERKTRSVSRRSFLWTTAGVAVVGGCATSSDDGSAAGSSATTGEGAASDRATPGGLDPEQVLRVVTGTDEDGRSTLTRDIAPTIVSSPESPGTWIAEQWVGESVPADLDGPDLAGREWQLEPPMGGSAFRLFQLPPSGSEGNTSELHATETIDYVVVISGRMWLVVDHGEVELGPGDCVVQRGTPHAWENRGAEPCVAAGVLISARPAEGSGPE